MILFCFFSSRRRHTRFSRDWSSDVCSSDLLDSLSGAGRGERGEFAQRCDVGALVQDEQQRRIERLSSFRAAVVGMPDDLLYERCEEWLQSALLVSGSAEVGGMAAAVEEALGAELGAHGRCQNA